MNYPYNPYFQNYPQKIQSEVIRVRGYDSARSINLAPNCSILLMDESEPVVWLCTSDGVGTVTATAYDITPHQEKPPVDVGNLAERVAAIETILNRMETKNESNAKPTKRRGESGED